MAPTSFQQHPIQQAYQEMISVYSNHLTHFLTLTFHQEHNKKQRKNNRHSWNLTDNTVEKSTWHFLAKINYKIYGHSSRRPKTRDHCNIVAISAFEGRIGTKHKHMHILLGNIPPANHAKLETMIGEIISDEPWIYGFDLREIYDVRKICLYITKDIRNYNPDVIKFEMIPAFLKPDYFEKYHPHQ